jgi:hypothetical protein
MESKDFCIYQESGSINGAVLHLRKGHPPAREGYERAVAIMTPKPGITRSRYSQPVMGATHAPTGIGFAVDVDSVFLHMFSVQSASISSANS